jgi:hypothetical protein
MNWRFLTARDIAAVVLALMLLAGLTFILAHPTWRLANGFAPNWHCRSIGGDDLVCLKDQQIKP